MYTSVSRDYAQFHHGDPSGVYSLSNYDLGLDDPRTTWGE